MVEGVSKTLAGQVLEEEAPVTRPRGLDVGRACVLTTQSCL